ncbi:MAG: hypothetical protein ACI82F_001224 [Planctomycetota bacterium]|jgi:hypothetical protein
MVVTQAKNRDALIRKSERDVLRWSNYVDTLLRAFLRSAEAPPTLGPKMEELRNKRDSVITKLEALKRHKVSGWAEARKELDSARRELRDAWRTVIGALDRECLFA